MASNSSLTLVLAIACFISLISPAISQACSRQNITFTRGTRFESCLDHPVLNTSLHYTYNATNSSLSVAYVATPSRSDGWVAWAINPTGLRMIGSQAFLAYNRGAGQPPVVNTYNISNYNLTVGSLTFDHWNLRAESMAGGRIVIYTSVKVPDGANSVNQVWQIGGNVTSGRPMVHPMTAANMASRNVLRLTGSNGPSSAPGPTTDGGGGSTTPGGPRNVGSMSTSVNFGAILVFLAASFIF